MYNFKLAEKMLIIALFAVNTLHTFMKMEYSVQMGARMNHTTI